MAYSSTASAYDIQGFVSEVVKNGVFSLDTEASSKNAWTAELELITMHTGRRTIAVLPTQENLLLVVDLLKMRDIRCIMWNAYYDCTLLHRTVLPFQKWRVIVCDGMVLSWLDDNRGAGSAVRGGAVHGLKERVKKDLGVKMRSYKETYIEHPHIMRIMDLRKRAATWQDPKKLKTYYNKIDNERRRRMRERNNVQKAKWNEEEAGEKARMESGELDKKEYLARKKARAAKKKELNAAYRDYHVDVDTFWEYIRLQLQAWREEVRKRHALWEDECISYAKDDAKYTYRLYNKLRNRIVDEQEYRGSLANWAVIERRIREIFVWAHIRGIKLDRSIFQDIAENDIAPTIETLYNEIHEILWKRCPYLEGTYFSLNSPADVSDMLFIHLRLKPNTGELEETEPSKTRKEKLETKYEQDLEIYPVLLKEYEGALTAYAEEYAQYKEALEEYEAVMAENDEGAITSATGVGADSNDRQIDYTEPPKPPVKPEKPQEPEKPVHVPQYKTGKDVLRFVDHPIIDKIKDYRSKKLLFTTFAVKLGGKKGNILHGVINTTGTDTGRMSSKNPNLQNIPSRSKIGKRMRHGFVARRGKAMVVADYSQIELRLVASICGVKAMIDEYNKYETLPNGLRRYTADLHTRTATEIDMDRDKIAKSANFLMVYMGGAERFRISTGVDEKVAKEVHKRFNEAYGEIKDYGYGLHAMWKQGCRIYELPLSGRIRFWDKQSQVSPGNLVNTYVQGSGADLLKVMIFFFDHYILQHERYRGRAEILMQIHDEIVIECDEELAPELAYLVKAFMEYPFWDLPLPVEAGVKYGNCWGISKDKNIDDIEWTPEWKEWVAKRMPFTGESFFTWESPDGGTPGGLTEYGKQIFAELRA